tara:strand:- start:930 stop:1517 length:588 start_codon:yes stop_codon:yes gene_type:complete
MSEFIHPQSVVTENGEVVDKLTPPVMSMKKLNGQGTIYKLTDANIESINVQTEKNGTLDLEKFVRSIRSNFGTGKYNFGGITHVPMPDVLEELGFFRVELNGEVDVSEDQHDWGKVKATGCYIFMPEGPIVMEIDSWFGFIEKDKDQMSEATYEIIRGVVENVPKEINTDFVDTFFDEHLDSMDKLSVMRDRVYD